jgi:hypothetical protein
MQFWSEWQDLNLRPRRPERLCYPFVSCSFVLMP